MFKPQHTEYKKRVRSTCRVEFVVDRPTAMLRSQTADKDIWYLVFKCVKELTQVTYAKIILAIFWAL